MIWCGIHIGWDYPRPWFLFAAFSVGIQAIHPIWMIPRNGLESLQPAKHNCICPSEGLDYGYMPNLRNLLVTEGCYTLNDDEFWNLNVSNSLSRVAFWTSPRACLFLKGSWSTLQEVLRPLEVTFEWRSIYTLNCSQKTFHIFKTYFTTHVRTTATNSSSISTQQKGRCQDLESYCHRYVWVIKWQNPSSRIHLAHGGCTLQRKR